MGLCARLPSTRPGGMREAMNLPGNGMESVVVWIALAVDGVWHGSALISLAVMLLGVSLPAPRALTYPKARIFLVLSRFL